MKFRKTVGTLTMAATAAITGVATATPATAESWDRIWYSTDDNPGATVKIRKYGDVVQVCDSDADGYSAESVVEWEYNSRWHWYTITASGEGNCTTRDYRTHNIPEGVVVYVSAGLYKTGTGTRFVSNHFFRNDN